MPIIEYENGQVDYQPPGIQGAYPVWSFPPIIRDAVNELSLNVQVPMPHSGWFRLCVRTSSTFSARHTIPRRLRFF